MVRIGVKVFPPVVLVDEIIEVLNENGNVPDGTATKSMLFMVWEMVNSSATISGPRPRSSWTTSTIDLIFKKFYKEEKINGILPQVYRNSSSLAF